MKQFDNVKELIASLKRQNLLQGETHMKELLKIHGNCKAYKFHMRQPGQNGECEYVGKLDPIEKGCSIWRGKL